MLWNKRNKWNLSLVITEKLLLKLQSCLFSGQINLHLKVNQKPVVVLYFWTFWGFLDSKFMWSLFYEHDESVWLVQTADYSFSEHSEHFWTFWGFLDTKFMRSIFHDYDLMMSPFDLPKQLIIVFLCSHVTNTTLVDKSRQILLRFSCM